MDVERVNPDFVRSTLDLGPGDVVDARQIAERANAVFALSDFDRVAYQLTGDPSQPTLDLHVEERSLGTARAALRPRPAHRHGRKHRVHARRRLPADMGQRPRRRTARIVSRRAHVGPRGFLLPAAGRRASLVRRARRDRAAIPRGHLPRRRRPDPLPVLVGMGRRGHWTGVRPTGRTARRRPFRCAVRRPGNRPAGPGARCRPKAMVASRRATPSTPATATSCGSAGAFARITYFHSDEALGGRVTVRSPRGRDDVRAALPAQRRRTCA